MTARNMDHLKYLERVARSDVDHLLEKEKTYQGSWKASGGRSAWFMMRRKIDRLLVMMAKPEEPHGFSLEDLNDVITKDGDDVTLDASILRYLRDVYVSENIFAKIRENPSGADGTPLAEIRDLRRYLLLAEAEMVARGVLSGFGETYETAVRGMSERMVPRYDEPSRGHHVAELTRPGTPENGGHHAAESRMCTRCGLSFETAEQLSSHSREIHREGLK